MGDRSLAIPRRLRISGREWRVILTQEAPTLKPGRPLSGYCDYDAHELVIYAGQPRLKQELTFVHEVLHAMLGRQRRYDEGVIRRLEGPLREVLLSGRRWARKPLRRAARKRQGHSCSGLNRPTLTRRVGRDA